MYTRHRLIAITASALLLAGTAASASAAATSPAPSTSLVINARIAGHCSFDRVVTASTPRTSSTGARPPDHPVRPGPRGAHGGPRRRVVLRDRDQRADRPAGDEDPQRRSRPA